MNKKTLIPLVGIVVLALIVTTIVIIKPNASAQQIPNGVRFSEVKKLSQGTRPRCLAENNTADTAVKKVAAPKNQMNSFDMFMGTRIIDMPAGYTTTTVHSFDGKTASGTNSYTDKNQKAFVGDLKSFNYVARLDINTKDWTLTSYIACAE